MARTRATFGPADVAKLRAKINSPKAIDVINKVIDGDEKVMATMTTARMKAIEIALRKTLPDTSSVELTGGGGGPMVVSWGKPED